MNELELSEHDVFHALETKHPEAVFEQQGFVFCGGMAWYRSNPRVIEFVNEIVNRCKYKCDDQVIVNQVVANVLGVSKSTVYNDLAKLDK